MAEHTDPHPEHWPDSHTHEEWESPSSYAERAPRQQQRDLGERPFTIRHRRGPVGSGKTALLLEALPAVCATSTVLSVSGHERHLHPRGRRIPDQERRPAERPHPRSGDRRLPARGDPRGREPQPARARGGSPRGGRCRAPCSSESGGDNLAAQYSRELADFTIYVARRRGRRRRRCRARAGRGSRSRTCS